MNTHHIIITEKSIIKSNNKAIDNLLNILKNFDCTTESFVNKPDSNNEYSKDLKNNPNESIASKCVNNPSNEFNNKQYINVIPIVRINQKDLDKFKNETFEKENYDIIMRYETSEIIFTFKKINFDIIHSYIPTISKINIIIDDDKVELRIIIKYILTIKKLNISTL